MPRFRAEPLELMASFRSGCAAGQLTALASALLSHEAGYFSSSGVAREAAAGGVENAACHGKPIGSGGKIL
jgi:hypothetical protein